MIQECDILRIQIALHLNPKDEVDRRIATLIDRVPSFTDKRNDEQLQSALLELRTATQEYLKKEWERVKQESISGPA